MPATKYIFVTGGVSSSLGKGIISASIAKLLKARGFNVTTQKLDPYINCILCACCYGACPVLGFDEEYLGPAAIAKLFRFMSDSRDQRGLKFLEKVDRRNGVWNCRTIFCPGLCIHPELCTPRTGSGSSPSRATATSSATQTTCWAQLFNVLTQDQSTAPAGTTQLQDCPVTAAIRSKSAS